MSSRFADAARRKSGQFAEAARELSWRAGYTRTPEGLWTRRQWRVGWDSVVHPRRMAALEVEEWMWNGPLGEALAELEDLRRVQEQAEWNRHHGWLPDSCERPGWETLTAEEFEAPYPDMTEADIQRHLEFLESVDRVDPEFEAGQ